MTSQASAESVPLVLQSARAHSKTIRKLLVPLTMLFSCFSSAIAEDLVIPESSQVQAAIEQYVEDARQAPGVVVGLIQDGQRQLFSYGDSGRSDLELSGETLFEMGSISKVFTGLLLVDMVLRGEVNYSDTIADTAPEKYRFSDAVGAITLEQLATHTSGLPRLAIDFRPVMRGLFTADPYAGSTADEIYRSIAFLSDDQLTTNGEFAYSNLGYGLLGQLLAQVAGSDFEDLLRARILQPMNVSSIAFGPSQADQTMLARGFNNGRAARHWTLDAYAAAGGLVASAELMLDFIEENLDPELDFVSEAQRPRGQSEGDSPRTLGVGYAHQEIGGRNFLWHNGGTGGFRTYFGFAPSMDFGIVVLTNGTGNADALTASLIRSGISAPEPYRLSWFGLLMAFVGIVIAPFTLLSGVFGAAKLPRPGRRAQDRLDLAVLVAAAGMMLVVSRLAGDWITIPFSLWWVGLVVTFAAAFALVRARFFEREWRTGGIRSLLGRGLILGLYLLVIVAFF